MNEEYRMSKKEVSRITVLTDVLNKRLRQTHASRILNLSVRHINRIIQAARKSSIYEVLRHKNRCRISNNKLSEREEAKIIGLFKQHYHDFGPTFATEKLRERHRIAISKETLRKLLIKHTISYPTRKRNRGACHVWRQRRQHFGELIQIDGSHHRWLEKRLNTELCLLLCIDDATNTLFARFYEYEGVFPVLDCLMRFTQKYGIPQALYSDKHSTYITTREPSVDEMLQAKKAQTQVLKVLNTLGIEHIAAHSPQAKGRVERVAETLQDRLVKEMRLRNISSIHDANDFLDAEYLNTHNQHFTVPAAHPASMFKQVPANFDYKWTFAIQDTRIVGNDFTISWNNRLFLLLNRSITIKRKKILVKQALDGSLQFSTKDTILRVQEVTQQDIATAQRNRQFLEKIAKEYYDKKSKKSWMDRMYIGANRSFYA